MKRLPFLVLLSVLAWGCSPPYRITKPVSKSLSAYQTISLSNMETEAWLNAHPEAKNNPNWAKEVEIAQAYVPDRAGAFLRRNFTIRRDQAPGSLNIQTKLTEFYPGSRAARYLVGFGAGKGRMGITTTLVDGDSGDVIGEANIYCSVSGGWGGGSFRKAYEFCGKATARLVLDHLNVRGR